MKKREKNKYKVDNAIIMAAGLSTRFAPLSYEYPKALVRVKGEIMIERQIRQLQEVGIKDISLVVGYKKELFFYLAEKFNVKIVENPDYAKRNNNSSLYYVRDILANSYICSGDNYFTENIFKSHMDQASYTSVYKQGPTKEWCFHINENDLIQDVRVGGSDAWIMIGPAFFTKDFSKKFVEILEEIYDKEATKPMFWEDIYIENIDILPMYIDRHDKKIIHEFDALEELRNFDKTYWENTGSKIIEDLCENLQSRQSDIVDIDPIVENGQSIGFSFALKEKNYVYSYKSKKIRELKI